MKLIYGHLHLSVGLILVLANGLSTERGAILFASFLVCANLWYVEALKDKP